MVNSDYSLSSNVSGANPSHGRPPTNRPRLRIPSAAVGDSDEDSDSDPDGDQDKEGDLLYSFYGTQPMDEQNPQFFEKSKTMQRVLSRREAAALKRTRRQVR